jgi:hypothetical protein
VVAVSKIVNRAREARAPEPPEHFLHSVGKHHAPGHYANERQYPIVPGPKYFGERSGPPGLLQISVMQCCEKKEGDPSIDHLFSSGMSLPLGGMGIDLRYA